MKRLQVLFLVALSSSLLLFGCGEKEETVADPIVLPIEETIPQPTEEPSAEDTEDSEDDTDVPPEEGMVRSPLTNEWIAEDIKDARPIAVMSPNDKNALPHYNFSKADIIYECPVEGGITRSMAVIKDWEGMDRIGNVRSCRDYFVYWALEWDSIYVHFGGPFYIKDIIEQSSTDNITGCSYGDGGKVGLYEDTFYRATDRSAPQNAYASAEGINKAIDKFGYSKTYRDNYYVAEHFKFASPDAPNTLESYSDAMTAKELNLAKAYPITKTSFTYNEDDGLYYRYMYGNPDVDAANNNQQLAFKNVFVQFTYHEVRDQKDYLAFQVHDTTRDGYYFTNGKAIHVTWEKTTDYSPTKYFDDNGNEVQVNTGKTMICVVKDGATIEVDGNTLN
ncbi:MAG: DUF3048 domain-containing protein [Lachnospiraceae bacterium]|nr:DUF3048 domain-containing protein [Lachnospiraceae bacterium]MBD5455752.1 DUF3048 domain-containing protein [Lachnospiraceae bacterium]